MISRVDYFQMHNGPKIGVLRLRILVIGLLAVSFCGCSTVPREEALKLASAGHSASSALASQLSRIKRYTQVFPELVAFDSQYDLCSASGKNEGIADCDDYNVSDETIETTRKLNALVEKRIIAVNELGKAYAALEAEAKYEAEADLSGAINGLIVSIDALSVAANLGTPPSTGLARQIPGRVAGWAARNRQVERLKVANVIIADATRKLAAALEVEKTVYDDVQEVVRARETQVTTKLIISGVVDRVDLVAPLIDGLGLKFAPKAADQINSSLSLTKAIASSYRARRVREDFEISESYTNISKSLRSLSGVHKSFEETGKFDLTAYTLFVTELANAVEASRPNP